MSRFCLIVSMLRGFITGIAMPPCFFEVRQPWGNTLASSPSPKLDAMPQISAASAQHSLKSRISSVGLYCAFSEPTGAEMSGIESCLPRNSMLVSTGSSGKMVSMLSLMPRQAFQLSFAPLPGDFEPGPGMRLPQARPLHSGQTLQFGPMFFFAFARTSL